MVVTGPTSSGKSSLAIWLAEQLDGELICCDSMQVYAVWILALQSLQKPNGTGFLTIFLIGLILMKLFRGRFVRESEEVIKKLKLEKRSPFGWGNPGMYLRSLLFGLTQSPRSLPTSNSGKKMAERGGNTCVLAEVERS
ncbi:MAG: hypothetical protein Ct9H90mP8_2860 [Pseudomonadota bacterium]|nr:MAG: hypothetical protein Ct9H90mP8_2860 [Pseudomonadota bacterium]